VLKINAGTLTPITLRDSSTLKVGQFVLVIGNPLGYAQTVTFGIISTLGRGLPESGPATNLPDLIQTSAPIYPGSSGGALVDLQGRLAGIPVMDAVAPGQATPLPGIGFAIPANRVRFITDQIIRTGRVADTGRTDLGITGVDATAPAQPDAVPTPFGTRVLEVEDNGPAAQAGIKQGDIITTINGKPVQSYQALLDLVARLHPGDKVQLQVMASDGCTRTITVILASLPAN
jgi:S1-C subfamily serine protease